MRVISGLAGGRPLKTVKGRAVRPTADRVRESLFSVIAARIPGSSFLDLCAGSGSVGIEALSRGASRCVFVDAMTLHLRAVEENLTATGLREGAELIRRDARAAVADLARRGSRFDLIFIDPPYGSGLVPAVLDAVARNGLLSGSGLAIAEHHKKDPVPDTVLVSIHAGGLAKVRELVFGETVLSLYGEVLPRSGRQVD